MRKKWKNPKFYQFYEHNFKIITYLQRKHPTAISILFFLMELMDMKNAIVISSTAIAEILDLHRSTVHRNIKHLTKHKIIDQFKSGSSSVFGINADVIWRESHNKKSTASFYAQVVLTENEQNQYDHEIKTKNRAMAEYGLYKDPLGVPTRPYSSKPLDLKKLCETETSNAGKQLARDNTAR